MFFLVLTVFVTFFSNFFDVEYLIWYPEAAPTFLSVSFMLLLFLALTAFLTDVFPGFIYISVYSAFTLAVIFAGKSYALAVYT